jgi:hypothetical protein
MCTTRASECILACIIVYCAVPQGIGPLLAATCRHQLWLHVCRTFCTFCLLDWGFDNGWHPQHDLCDSRALALGCGV